MNGFSIKNARVGLRSLSQRVAMLCLCIAPLAILNVPSAAAEVSGFTAADLRLVSQQQLSPRLLELTFETAALDVRPKVQILLPDGYNPKKQVRYPVLYLLHGGGADGCKESTGVSCGRDWVGNGDAESITAGLPLIVVIPDGGPTGFYTNWWNYGKYGDPMWQTFHIDQLLPWIDANFQTIPHRGQRASAGLSMGGFGAVSYAARHPDLFSAAASFSGAVDMNNVVLGHIIAASSISDGAGVPGAIWGPYETEEVRTRGDNPWDLAANLANTEVALYTGNGLPGGPDGNLADRTERQIWEMNISLHRRLLDLGIQHEWNDYGPGGHSFYYWKRSLADWLPRLMEHFAKQTPAPSSFTYATIRPEYNVNGWKVGIGRSALEFSSLHVLSRHRFEVTGSGTASIVTAPLYHPGKTYSLTLTGLNGTTNQMVLADRAGRLALSVPLGPSNQFQQYTIEADAAGSPLLSGEVGNLPYYDDGGGSQFYRTAVSVSEKW